MDQTFPVLSIAEEGPDLGDPFPTFFLLIVFLVDLGEQIQQDLGFNFVVVLFEVMVEDGPEEGCPLAVILLSVGNDGPEL